MRRELHAVLDLEAFARRHLAEDSVRTDDVQLVAGGNAEPRHQLLGSVNAALEVDLDVATVRPRPLLLAAPEFEAFDPATADVDLIVIIEELVDAGTFE